ncbi:MAG TPA: hypothetical protein VI893_03500, partial [Thermoplasmata archaeon]|nr:hypothetical protein [Thermoplasmata archaeon]
MAYSTAHPLRGLTVNIHSPEFVYGMRVDSPATMTKGERAKLLVQASAYTLAHDLRKGWRLRRAEAPTGPWAKNIQELRTDGVTVIPGFMSTSEVDALRAKVFEFVDRFKHTTRLANGTQVIFRDEEQHRGVDTGMIDVFNIDHSVPEVAKIRDHPSVHEIVRGGFARPTNLKFVTSYINRSVTNPRGYHADTLATTEFKAFLVLTDVNDREDGAHAYIPKTHRFSFQKYRNIWRNVMDKGYSISDTNLV